MTITRERQPDHSGREIGWRGDPRAGERSQPGLRHLYRGYAGRRGINFGRRSAAALRRPFVKKPGQIAQPSVARRRIL